MEVIKALRISMSIPFIFKPYKYNDKIWVDGGCMNNFPIEIFNDKLNDVIGIYLDNITENNLDIDSYDQYISKIFKCIIKGLDYNKIKLFSKQTIVVKCKNVSTKWDISKEEKKELFDIGIQAVNNFYNL